MAESRPARRLDLAACSLSALDTQRSVKAFNIAKAQASEAKTASSMNMAIQITREDTSEKVTSIAKRVMILIVLLAASILDASSRGTRRSKNSRGSARSLFTEKMANADSAFRSIAEASECFAKTAINPSSPKRRTSQAVSDLTSEKRPLAHWSMNPR